MRSHNAIQKNLYEYLNDELSGEDRLATEAHLRSCAKCSRELQTLQDALDLVTRNVQKPSEQRSELYWQQFAANVDRRIRSDSKEAESPSFIARLLDLLVDNRKPISFGFVSALTMVAFAFGVWSIWMRSPIADVADSISAGAESAASPGTVQRTAMELRADNYLEQSKILLIGIMNTDAKSLVASRSFLDHQREMSRTLVRESEEISSGLTEPSQRRLKELVSDLGLILIQIANLESKHGIEGVEIVKGGVERNGILFKINVEEIQQSTRLARTNKIDSHGKSNI